MKKLIPLFLVSYSAAESCFKDLLATQFHLHVRPYFCAADYRSHCRLLLLQLIKEASTIFAEIKFLGGRSDPSDLRAVTHRHRLAVIPREELSSLKERDSAYPE